MFALARLGPFRPGYKLGVRQVLAMLALLSVGAAAFAQEDPPSRIGRVSDTAGGVFLAPDAADANWQPVGINYPVTMGDSVWVSQGGRAEIDFGAGQIRLSDEANVHFSQLDDRQFSAYLASGIAILRLRTLDPGETAKFDAANAQIDILRPGNYRMETTADGLYTSFVVRDGQAELRIGDRATVVYAGQTAVIDGSGSNAAMAVRDGYGNDGFDAWSAERDRRLETGSISSRYVSSYVPGVNDLDRYGSWESTPTYGAVWYPRAVAADWVPYGDGRWTFVNPWGWTWVDSAPWGWAPFHYGRWVRQGSRWGWCPGTFVARPVYAPALVAWYGGSAGTSWSVNVGNGPTFGWVPLSWGEPYWPHYRYSNDYWRVINRPYAVNVYRVPPTPQPTFSYANARIPGAVTAVSGEVFTGRRPIVGSRYPISPAALAGAAITTAPLGIRPMTKPLLLDNLPRGIPAPAGSYVRRGNEQRPEFRAPGAVEGRPFTGQPGGVGGRINEPAPGSGRPAVNPPAFVGRPGINEPASGTGRPSIGAPPTVGRPSINEPSPGMVRPSIREPSQPSIDPRQSGGQTFVPPGRPSPITRQPINEPAPTVNRPMVRESAPNNPGMSPPPQIVAPPTRPTAPVVREPPTVAPQYNPGLNPGQSYTPPPRPAAPIVREPAPMPPQSNPAPIRGQSYTPPPRPAAPVIHEPAPIAAPPPAAVPAPVQNRQPPGNPQSGGRPAEPQIPIPQVPAPSPR